MTSQGHDRSSHQNRLFTFSALHFRLQFQHCNYDEPHLHARCVDSGVHTQYSTPASSHSSVVSVTSLLLQFSHQALWGAPPETVCAF